MSLPPRTQQLRAAVALFGALVLAACGGGDEDATVGTVPPASVVSSTTTAATLPPTTTTTSTIPLDFEGAAAFDRNSSVSTVGIDALIFGMTLNRAQNALEAQFVPVTEPVDPVCHTYRPAGGPAGVILTVTEGTVERVDITNDTLTTRSGAGVGMTEDALFELFGDLLTRVARDGGGNTITFTPSDPSDAAFRVIFETDGSVVTAFRSGRLPQVSSFSPCGQVANQTG